MDRASTTNRGLSDAPSSGWSSARPTLNTSPLTTHPDISSPSERSPHPSSIPPSSASSPWSQAASLSATHSPSQFLPLSSASRTASADNLNPNANIQQFNNTDWTSVFSVPLNSSVFAALAANGVLGQLPSLSQGTPTSLPSSAFHRHYSSSSSSSPTISISTQPSTSGSWTQPSAVFNHNPSLFLPKAPLPRSNPSHLASQLQVSKDKLPPCQSTLPFSCFRV